MIVKSSKRVAVIGAGIAGIATALRLARKGFAVTIYEGQPQPGGKLSEFHLDGFRFDAGPSLFTLPEQVDALFALHGRDPRQYFKYHRLNTICQYFFPGGTAITAHADKVAFAKELALKTHVQEWEVLEFLDASKEKYELTRKLFLESSLHKIRSYLTADALRALSRLPRLDANRTMNQANTAAFRDERVVQMFNRFATYNGSDPYQSPATLNIIPHLEHNLGAYFPEGGMYRIVQALVKLAAEVGIEIKLNTQVQEIVVEKGRTTGIKLQNTFQPFDVVVSNMDIVNTYRKLLSKVDPPKKLLQLPKSSSALIFYLGIKKQFPQLNLHNIFFSENYREEFSYLFEKKKLYYDPTVYIYISSKANPADAPQGMENWFVMVNAPHDAGQPWPQMIAKAREHILDKLEKMLGEPVRKNIVAEEQLNPLLIEERTSSYLGSLYGNSSNNKFSAFLRHSNFSSRIKNLYFCGGSVHPGGGIPLCLFSAKIVSELLEVR